MNNTNFHMLRLGRKAKRQKKGQETELVFDVTEPREELLQTSAHQQVLLRVEKGKNDASAGVIAKVVSTDLVPNLNKIESHLKSFDPVVNGEHWEELSLLVNEFVQTEFRTLPMNDVCRFGSTLLCEAFDGVNTEFEKLSQLVHSKLDSLHEGYEKLLDERNDKRGLLSKKQRLSFGQTRKKLTDRIAEIGELGEEIVVKKHEIYVKNDEIAAYKNKIRKKEEAIRKHFFNLFYGTFFASVDNVFKAEEIMIDDSVDVNFFKRESLVAIDCYETTAVGAIEESNVIAVRRPRWQNSSDQSQSSSDRSYGPPQIDIFGVKSHSCDNAHLLPHADSCAKNWFPFVPWVLYISRVTNRTEPGWDILQKCIHGYKISKGGETEPKQVANTGIKNFPTNRIRLCHPTTYLEKYPSLLIIPILDKEHIKAWDGSGYSAIVLAGNCDDDELEAREVYKAIGASEGGCKDDFMATRDDLEKACRVLKEVVLCVVKSFSKALEPWNESCTNEIKSQHEEFRDSPENARAKPKKETKQKAPIMIDKNTASTAASILSAASVAFVPIKVKIPVVDLKEETDVFASEYVKVRKVLFSKACSESSHHPAPDPMLLLARAASNWLKRHDMLLLPGYGDVISNDDSSDFSLCSEKESDDSRLTRPQISEIRVLCSVSTCVDVDDDESLTDSDE